MPPSLHIPGWHEGYEVGCNGGEPEVPCPKSVQTFLQPLSQYQFLPLSQFFFPFFCFKPHGFWILSLLT